MSMTGRSRHGLHVVRDGEAPDRAPGRAPVPRPREPLLSLHQRSVVLAVGGRLDADTAGRLRMFLAMFSTEGGPRELVLDMSGVLAIDEEGMAPVLEAAEAMRLRAATLRLVSVSAAVTRHLDDGVSLDHRALLTGPPTEPDAAGDLGAPVPDDGRPHRGQE
ncbi:anti-anti-sigma factor [Geodermatophilus aquaeductus]|uniref:Anti-anti-sigma factor n=2 Tax=Geodermatophilus aquaeductus TaxID=1564161 RepID=A0A521FK96_9ACTN|nr:anti-anti-sigma factor [Geodermatophilus aquaeductus]